MNDDTKGLTQSVLLLEPMTQRGIDELVKAADSVSLAKLAGQSFTIIKTEPSAYDGQAGYKITTKDSYSIDGKKQNKFHTTRYAIVSTLAKEEVQAALTKGDTIGPVRCELTKAKKGGKDYWSLVTA